MRNPDKRRGVSAILILFLLAAFIGVAAMGVDFGRMYLYRTQLHNAADAAAMAGAQRLLVHDWQTAEDTALAYVARHSVENHLPSGTAVPGMWDWTTSAFVPAPGNDWSLSTNNAVQVTTNYTANFTFGRFYGLQTRARSATSIAAIGSVGVTDCVRPFAVPYESLLGVLYPGAVPPVTYNLTTADVSRLSQLTMANQIYLKTGDASASYEPGSFYAVREPPVRYASGAFGNPWSGANMYRDAISAACSGLSMVVGVGDWLQGEQGNMQGPTRTGTAILCGVPGNPSSFVCVPPVTVKVAIWDISDKTVASPNAFRVKYIGVFVLTGFHKGTSSEPDGIMGYFQTLASAGGFNPRPGPIQGAALVY